MATDPKTGEKKKERVLEVFKHKDIVIDFTVQGSVITTTPDHPFWNASTGRFERTDALKPGDRLLSNTGLSTRVGSIDWTNARIDWAYDLDVTGTSTYSVGQQGVLVHNCDVVPSALVHRPGSPGSLGSSGRTAAGGANETAAMEAAMANPGAGSHLPDVDLSRGPWFAGDGWRKYSQEIDQIEVHYNGRTDFDTGRVAEWDDFKFKDWFE